ncbi:MAG: winged helix-turn-helix transcriptional regulator [Chitinophagales bacterium]|nr:winged helix-turn-helix transcriptional regulator [Chitinophagales bacterium]
MTVAKKEMFNKDENEIASIAKALGHPARIVILKILSDKGGCSCGELVSALPLSQSTVSQHLQELKNADLINWIEDGPKVWYTVNSRMCDMALNRFHYMLNRIRV